MQSGQTQRGNYIEGFRFSDEYEDVFIEDDHYLYACAEPYNWAYMFVCNPYRVLDNGELLREDTVSADAPYLLGLKRAPEDIARRIIKAETERTLQLMDEMDATDEAQRQLKQTIGALDYILEHVNAAAERLEGAETDITIEGKALPEWIELLQMDIEDAIKEAQTAITELEG